MFQRRFPYKVEIEKLVGFEGHLKNIVLYSTVHEALFF